MAKIVTQRIYDAAKELATDVGQKLSNLIVFITTTFEEVISALRNGLTYEDNFDCKVMSVELLDSTAQIVSASSGLKKIKEIRCRQVLSETYGPNTFHWYIAGNGSPTVVMTFTGSPTASTRITVVLLVQYG